MRRIWTAAILTGATILFSGRSYANEEITVDLPGGATMEMVWIEPGTFTMGSPDAEKGRSPIEIPHQVTISHGFYLGKYELTQGQWTAVMGNSPWSGQTFVQENPNNPAVYIEARMAGIFASKLNLATGDSLFRLPTEAEWEYACRAGTSTAWSYGGDGGQMTDYAWISDNALNTGEGYGHQVGMKKPNPWGLYDMYGNVWEWVRDVYKDYSVATQTDPVITGDGRPVKRGGGFESIATTARSASRGYRVGPDVTIGMRLVKMGPAPTTAVTPQSWGQTKNETR